MKGPTKSSKRVALAVSVASAVVCAAPGVQAYPEILRENTNPWFFTGGIGYSHSFNSCNGSKCTSFGFEQFKFAPEIGGHFSGTFEGPALGAGFDVAYGGYLGYDAVRFEPGMKFWWDILVKEGLGIYVAPFVKAGYGLQHFAWKKYSDTDHFFYSSVGAAGRLSLADRAVVFVQPVTLNIFVGPDGVSMAYDVLVGGGITWGGG